MLFDSHIHTKFSADSEMEASAALARAESQGLGLVFTEHLDAEQPGPGNIDFTFDPEDYWREYEPLRGQNLRLGIEVGMREATEAQSRAFVARVPFDFVLGSLHFCEELDLYYPDFFADRTKEEAWRIYLGDMARELRRHSWVDALGHIDYIARSAPYENPELDYGSFQTEIEDVLRACLETDTVLELNTRRLNTSRGLKELVPVYKRYHELGGRCVTLGSDAHREAAVGAHFSLAVEMVKELGLRPVTFAKRQMEPCDLG